MRAGIDSFAMRAEDQAVKVMKNDGFAMSGRRLRLTLRVKLLMVFAALGLIGLGNWLVVDSTLASLRGTTTQANLVGSIRWISQRVHAATLLLAYGRHERAAIEAYLDRLDDVILVLAYGGEHLGLQVRAPSEFLQAAMEPLPLAVRNYRATVSRAMEELAGRGVTVADLEDLRADGDRLLTTADGIAAALSVQIATIEEEAARNLKLLALLDLVILLAALHATRIQIIRPLRALAAASRRFSQGHYDERVAIASPDEIGDLALAFNRMAGDIQRDMQRIANDRDALEQAQHGLRKLSRAVDCSPASVVITDTTGLIEYVNPKFTEVTGYSSVEVLGRNAGFHKSGQTPRARYAELWDTIASGREWRGELLNRKKDGELFLEDTRISPLMDECGKTTHFIAIKEDVTERQRAAEELRVSKELFQTTFDSAAVGIALYDLSGRFLLANHALCETLGYSQEELLNRTLQEITHPDDLAKAAEFERRVLDGELARCQFERRCYHRQGHVVWAVLSVALVRDPALAPLYFIGQIVDISTHKSMELELIESRKNLRKLAAHRDAVREDERKRIALEVHDELGQLLTALKMDISLLRMQFGADAEIGKRTADMRELVEKTIGVVRQVTTHLRPAALDLGIVPALEWLVEDFSQRAGIACDLNLSGDEFVLSDVKATAVFRIVQESLTNVMRHACASSVSISMKHSEHTLFLEIEDDGHGFDLEAARKGASFGLLGIQERVLMLGGFLKIDTGPDRGTTLMIRIPQETEAQR